jgi:DNA repair exonuclease SbcCD ATPase subunit
LRASYEEVRRAAEPIRRITLEIAALPALDETVVARATELRTRLASDLQALSAQVANDQEMFRDLEERTAARASLAAAALPLLGERCPVCDQEIDSDHVERLLRLRLEDADAGELVTARATLAASLHRLSDLEREAAAARASEVKLEDVEKQRVVLAGQLTEHWAAVKAAAVTPYFELPELSAGNIDGLDGTLEAMVQVGQAMRATVAAAQLSTLAESRTRVGSDLDQAESELVRARRDLEESARRTRESSALLKAVREGVVRVVGRAMTSVNPNFSEVYRRLAPHPTFTDLSFEHDFYRSRGRSMPVVVDPLWEIEANPAVVCSVGQLNVVALSYFLAFAMAGSYEPMPFVILDDPLQSLDDVNALGFSDFCRRLKRGRQVILTTHDPRFAALLRRKLAPRMPDEVTLTVDMVTWDRSGPEIHSERRVHGEDIDLIA